ncbi:TolC family protein [Lutibacter holmesii]|uniref:TolC family protein n=1 Tax=Lutibacter holmesii TaxID=1137985 RepID=A0ABW3WN85_9FLAO
MKNISKIIFFIIINFCLIQVTTAQTSEIKSKPREILFPPLEELIEAAIKNNPAVKFRISTMEAKESLVKSERNYWTRNFGLQADFTYGNINNSSYSIEAEDSNLLSTSTTQLNYGAGVYMKFPIFDIINRKAQIKQAELEVDQAKNMAESQKNEIRELVIKQYQEAILKQKLLNIKSHNLGNARVNMEMVEKEFRNGVIAVSEYVRISDITSKIEVEYETAKSDFFLAKKLLENTIGFTIGKTNSN